MALFEIFAFSMAAIFVGITFLALLCHHKGSTYKLCGDHDDD